MKIKNLFFFLVCLISIVFTGLASANVSILKPGNTVLNDRDINTIEKHLLDIKNSSSLNKNQKILKTINTLKEIKPHISEFQFVKLYSEFESTLYESTDDVDIKFNQLGFSTLVLNSTLWPSRLSKKEFIDKTINIAESISNNQKYNLSTQVIINFLELAFLYQANRYEELDAKLKDAYALVESNALWDEYKSQGNFLSKTFFKSYASKQLKKVQKSYLTNLRVIELNSHIARGNITKTLEIAELLATDFRDVAEFYSEHHKEMGSLAFEYLASFLIADEYLGQDQALIEKADFILKLLPSDGTNLDKLKFESNLYRKISNAYLRAGNKQLADKNRDIANQLLIKSEYIDLQLYTNEFTYLMDQGNFQQAKTILDKIESTYINPAQESFDIFKNFLVVMRRYNNAGINNNRVNNEDTKQFFAAGVLLLEDSYYKSIENGEADLQNDLEVFSALNNAYYRSGDYYYAAYYAKRYVNTLQELRTEINSIDKKYIGGFTEKHSENLKRFANNFYEVGDLDSALNCLSIIKENEFFDFIRRADDPKKFLSKLDLSVEENDFTIRLKTLTSEIKLLQETIAKKNDRDPELTIISKSLESKISELKNTRKNLDDYISKIAQSPQNLTKKLSSTPTNLRVSEAFIHIDIGDNEVFSFVTLPDKSVRRFTTKIDNYKIRSLILEFNLAISKRNEVSKSAITKLSEIVIGQPLEYIADKNIKIIKVKTGDFIGYIPLNILKYANKDIGESYVLEIQGLDTNKTVTDNTNINLHAYGATKGNNEFIGLPAVKNEINALMNLPVSQDIKTRKSFLDNQFTKNSLLSSFKDNISLVHIATHFKATGNTADAAKMLLGDGKTISLQELHNDLPISNQLLVTLSACDTGAVIPMGKITNKRQSITYEGLFKIFQLKGASNVISTLWSVSDDATADFMEAYYLILFNNKIRPSEALHYTQNVFRYGSLDVLPKSITLKTNGESLHFVKNLKKYSHPYYWSAFQISTKN